ncbi:hypothetical protein BDW02DRAFT_570441 [Decorospora gaudefroyi]|uniref:Uncharacterized protein n=1 Tax=Decorospora gaudefroyi TaxID=184978 RepID=A0A6A5KEY7_9PLEO|nr:hypothetical protein BDW02DRAFT_570441 [Decorospora gaudefroyi]
MRPSWSSLFVFATLAPGSLSLPTADEPVNSLEKRAYPLGSQLQGIAHGYLEEQWNPNVDMAVLTEQSIRDASRKENALIPDQAYRDYQSRAVPLFDLVKGYARHANWNSDAAWSQDFIAADKISALSRNLITFIETNYEWYQSTGIVRQVAGALILGFTKERMALQRYRRDSYQVSLLVEALRRDAGRIVGAMDALDRYIVDKTRPWCQVIKERFASGCYHVDLRLWSPEQNNFYRNNWSDCCNKQCEATEDRAEAECLVRRDRYTAEWRDYLLGPGYKEFKSRVNALRN